MHSSPPWFRNQRIKSQKRLADIAATPKHLGNCAEPLVVSAKEQFVTERDIINGRMVKSGPVAGQAHHCAARIDAPRKQRARQEKLRTEHGGQTAELGARIVAGQTFFSEQRATRPARRKPQPDS